MAPLSDDATEVLQEMEQEVISSFESDGAEAPEEFIINLVPCWSEIGAASFQISDLFAIVINGSLKIGSKSPDSEVRVIEYVDRTPRDRVVTHSYLILSMHFPQQQGGLTIPNFWMFAFLGIDTSGYAGTGPTIHARNEKIIQSGGRRVKHRQIEGDVSPLSQLMKRKGPVLSVRFPLDEDSIRSWK